MPLQDIIRGLSSEDKVKVVEALERYSQDFITSDLWENTLPLDPIVRQLAMEELVADFLTEVYGDYDPKLKDKNDNEIGIGDIVVLETGKRGFIVGLDPETGLLNIEIDEDSDEGGTEVTILAKEVLSFNG